MEQLRRHTFLIGLAIAVATGFWGHAWLIALAQLPWLKTAIVLTVMAMMAAPVPLELFVKTITRPWPGLLGSMVCMGLVPLLGWWTAGWLQAELAGGLIVTCCVPSTQASAAVITRKAGGDETIPIFVTILTNLSCVAITPLWLILMIGSQLNFNLLSLIYELAILVFLPIGTVQLLRWQSQRFRQWADRAKPNLTIGCQAGILAMVAIGSAQMGSRWFDLESQNAVPFQHLLAVVLAAISIHLAALAFGYWTAKLTRVSRPQAIGVAFSGSQKTLMIGLNLAIDFGVSILPMIIYHVFQLLADAFIAQHLGRKK